MSVHPAHSQRNFRATPAEMLARFREILRHPQLQERKSDLTLRVYLSTCWGLEKTSDVSLEQIADLGTELLEMGFVELTLCDTAALGNPDSIGERFQRLSEHLPLERLGFHGHDPNWQSGAGVANTVAAIGAGIRRVDCSILGLGGCPANDAPEGNPSTEDLIAFLERRGWNVRDVVASELQKASMFAARNMSLDCRSITAEEIVGFDAVEHDHLG
jgi:hydroxymethylglutaryl-CoA lyase